MPLFDDILNEFKPLDHIFTMMLNSYHNSSVALQNGDE